MKDIRELGDASEEPMEGRGATMYRALTARGLYLSQDRSDLGYAVKELSRNMSGPREVDAGRLKRLGRYLIGKERMVTGYKYQGIVNEVVVWTDSDHAGCGETRKSTSGGVMMLGKHMIKAWSKQQAVVAISSGEAEYYALVKGGSEGLGVKGIMKDMGYEVGIEMRTDASAAIGIVNRRDWEK